MAKDIETVRESNSLKKSKRKKYFKQEQGITLVALVITIVILIILATVAISFAFGDNGIVKYAEDARDYASNDEKATATLLNSATEYIDSEILENAEEIPAGMKVNAEKISQAPNKFYGKEVTGYTAPHEGVDKWRIFYSDGTNIYLIADDYIAGENAPNGKGNSTITQNDTYKLSFNDIINDYSEGASWISQNSKGAKWLSQYLSSQGTSTNENIKATAYMMDTNVWSAYYAGEDAEYAMGGPTLEMFCASYKDTHPSKYIECGNLNSYGYNIRWNGGSWDYSQGGLAQDDFNSIYIKSNSSYAGAMWLASPSTSDNIDLMYAHSYGNVGHNGFTDTYYGLRPLVCLKSNVQLEMQDNATLAVVK